MTRVSHLENNDNDPQADSIEPQRIECLLPEGCARVKTGPLQLGDNCPGVFIGEGDSYHYSAALSVLLGDLERGVPPSEIHRGIAKSLAHLLGQCSMP